MQTCSSNCDNQLERLDQKRLEMQRVMSNLRCTPYSTRLRRNLAQLQSDVHTETQRLHFLIRSTPSPHVTEAQETSYKQVTRRLEDTFAESCLLLHDTRQTTKRPSLCRTQQQQQQTCVEMPALHVEGLDRHHAEQLAALHAKVMDVQAAFRIVREMVDKQQDQLDAAETHIEQANVNAQEAHIALTQASRWYAARLVTLASVAGAAMGGPIGAVLVGVKLSAIAGGACAGAVMGAWGSRLIQRVSQA